MLCEWIRVFVRGFFTGDVSCQLLHCSDRRLVVGYSLDHRPAVVAGGGQRVRQLSNVRRDVFGLLEGSVRSGSAQSGLLSVG